MANLALIVGLGNPGRQYAGTRHNAGFMTVDRLAEAGRARWALEKKFKARLARVEIRGHVVLLCKPVTFMNESGEAVGPLTAYYHPAPDRLLVVVDDADLPLGELRLRPRGSSGGHHGLESITRRLGTQEFARLRIGIGRARGAREITGYVLGRFAAGETALLEKVLTRASEQVQCWLAEGIAKAMSRFNGVVAEPTAAATSDSNDRKNSIK